MVNCQWLSLALIQYIHLLSGNTGSLCHQAVSQDSDVPSSWLCNLLLTNENPHFHKSALFSTVVDSFNPEKLQVTYNSVVHSVKIPRFICVFWYPDISLCGWLGLKHHVSQSWYLPLCTIQTKTSNCLVQSKHEFDLIFPYWTNVVVAETFGLPQHSGKKCCTVWDHLCYWWWIHKFNFVCHFKAVLLLASRSVKLDNLCQNDCQYTII